MISAALIAGLIFAESRGNDRALGRNGEVGCLQIKMGVIHDVNYQLGTRFTGRDRYDRAKSIEICQKYLEIYYSGPRCTDWGYAILWHFGPTGRHRASFDQCLLYWETVNEGMYKFYHEQKTSTTRGPVRRFLARLLPLGRGPHPGPEDRHAGRGADPHANA